MKKIILIILSVLNLNLIFAQENSSNIFSYSIESIKDFGIDLYNQGFLDEAETEFKRYLIASGKTSQNISFDYLTKIYSLQKDLQGLNWLENNFSDFNNTQYCNLVVAKTGLLFKNRNSDELINYLQNNKIKMEKFDSIYSDFHFEDLYNLSIKVLQTPSNKPKQLPEFEILNKDNPDLELFNDLITVRNSIKQKSPGLALFFSALLPGAGRWYTSSFSSGLTSFLTVGSFIGATIYTGIKSEWKSWQPYVFGTIGLSLYIAELYGAYKDANRFNEAEYRKVCGEIDKIYEKLF